MKKLLCILPFLFFTSLSFSQSPQLIWEKTIGSSKNDEAYQIILTSDNHFLIVGYTQPKDRYDLDLFLVKLNPKGEVIWEKNYGSQQVEIGYAISETKNGDFIVVGKAETNLESSQVWVLKINTDGEIIWNKKYGKKNYDLGKSVFITKDSQIVIGGSSEGESTKINHAYFLVLDQNGSLLKEQTFGGDHFEKEIPKDDHAMGLFHVNKGEVCNKIIPSKNGGYLFVGNTITKANANLATDGWLVRLDNMGQMVWDKNFGPIGGDDILDVFENKKGEIFCVGERYDKPNGRMDIWLIKFDKDGNILLDKTFGDKNFNSAKSIFSKNDDEILISGFTSNKTNINYKTVSPDTLTSQQIEQMLNNGFQKFSVKNKEGKWKTILQKIIPLTPEQESIKTNRDIWLGKITNEGNLIWEKTFGGNDDDEAFSVVKDKRGNILLAGYTRSKGNGLKDIWIMKLGNP